MYKDKMTGQNKGECTVTYEDVEAARSAIDWFSGKEFGGNIIKVSMAERRTSTDRTRGGGGGGGRGGFRGRGRGGGGGGPPGMSCFLVYLEIICQYFIVQFLKTESCFTLVFTLTWCRRGITYYLWRVRTFPNIRLSP